MFPGSNVKKFYVTVEEKAVPAKNEIIERLKNRLHLQQVHYEDECDVMISFVLVVSRAGTDIEAALNKIETRKPIVLVVLHITFDPEYVAPQSSMTANRERVFAVDFLFDEEAGLLSCVQNDRQLKFATDHLISLGASEKATIVPENLCRQLTRSHKITLFNVVLILIIVLVILIILACLHIL